MTIETEHRSFGIFFARRIDAGANAKPIADGGDLAERNAGLRHAERPGIHSEKDHALRSIAVAAQINLMRGPGVMERIINVRDRRTELQFANGRAESLGGFNE